MGIVTLVILKIGRMLTAIQPSLGFQHIPSDLEVGFFEHLLAGVPGEDFLYRIFQSDSILVSCNPMDGGQKFHSIRRFKSLD